MTTSTAPLVVTARTWDGGGDLIIDEDNATSALRLDGDCSGFLPAVLRQ